MLFWNEQSWGGLSYVRKAAEEHLGQNVPGGEQPVKGPIVEAGVVCPGTSKEASVTGGWCQSTGSDMEAETCGL